MKKRARALGIDKQVVFHGAIFDYAITGAYLFASDLMIIPENVGLSLNHAMAFGCPVLSCKEKPSWGRSMDQKSLFEMALMVFSR